MYKRQGQKENTALQQFPSTTSSNETPSSKVIISECANKCSNEKENEATDECGTNVLLSCWN